jgi:uncharacterized membrane protein YccC
MESKSGVLAIVAGLVFAMVITTLLDGRDIKVVGFVAVAVGAVLAAVLSLILWSKTLNRE